MLKKLLCIIPVLILYSSMSNVHSAKINVGLIYDVRGRGDLSFCDAAYAGAEKASKKWDIRIKEVNPGQSTDIERAVRGLAKLNYNLIIGVGFLFREPMNRVAGDFPNTNFVLIDAEANPSNVASLIYKAHEGTFLAGIIASMKTDTMKVGFIGGMKIPLVEAFEIGYEAGIKTINPKVVLLSNYVGVTPQAFDDPAKGKELALSQYKKGVDIILAAAGASGLGVLEAAKETKKYIIWVDSNGNSLAPGLVLTSIIKGVELSVYQSIENVVNGTFSGGLKSYGLKEGGVEYIVDHVNKDLLSNTIIQKVEEYKSKIIAGDIKVPSQRKQNKKGISVDKLTIVVPGDSPPQIQGSPHLERLKPYGNVVVYTDRPKNAVEKIQRAENADILINSRGMVKWQYDVLPFLPKLKLISLCSIGTDMIALDEAKKRGIVVCNQPGRTAPVVAEHSFGLMFALAKRAAFMTSSLKNGNWPRMDNVYLQGKTLGIIGTGHIGAEMARLGNAIGMNVVGWTYHPSDERAKKLGIRYVDFDDLLRISDVVSLHVKLTEESIHLIGENELSIMKPNALIINVARGKVIDVDALILSLNNGDIGGAAIDVYDQEPLPDNHPLLTCEHVILTPHCADMTPEGVDLLNEGAVDNIIAFLEGSPINVVV